MAKKLIIDLEKEYRLRIEEKQELANSFFNDVYKQAFKQVDGIVKWTNEFKEIDKECDFKRERVMNIIILLLLLGKEARGNPQLCLQLQKLWSLQIAK